MGGTLSGPHILKLCYGACEWVPSRRHGDNTAGTMASHVLGMLDIELELFFFYGYVSCREVSEWVKLGGGVDYNLTLPEGSEVED